MMTKHSFVVCDKALWKIKWKHHLLSSHMPLGYFSNTTWLHTKAWTNCLSVISFFNCKKQMKLDTRKRFSICNATNSPTCDRTCAFTLNESSSEIEEDDSECTFWPPPEDLNDFLQLAQWFKFSSYSNFYSCQDFHHSFVSKEKHIHLYRRI